MDTVLVTGFNGFIGSHLIPKLIQKYNVVGLSTSTNSQLNISQIKSDSTKIFLGNQKHWRLVDESLVTFMTSKAVVLNYMQNFMSMATTWKDPWEKPLHDIYKEIPCFSPIPSLSIHCSNINSIFGLSPNLDWKLLWDENSDH